MKTISVLIIEPEQILQYVNDRFLTTCSFIQIQQTELIENAISIVEKKSFDMILFDCSWESFEDIKKSIAIVKKVSMNKNIICAWQYTFLTEIQLDSLAKNNELVISKPLTPIGITRLYGQADNLIQPA